MGRVHGYESYRGRSGTRTALIVVIVVLLVVLLAVVAGYFVLQKYVVYTDDGRARVVLPFLEEREPEPTSESVEDPVVIVTDDPRESLSPDRSPGPEALYPVALPRTALTDGSAAAAVAAAGGNAALFDLKGDDGYLSYVSALPEALTLGSSAADPAINNAIRELTGSELYTVARVSCFRDNHAPRMDNSLAIRTTGGYNWLDPMDVRWTDPGNPYIQGYLVGVIRELAQLGFDEILLDCAAYPAQGRLEIISRPEGQTPAARTAVLEDFYAAAEAALADFPEVKLSLAAAPDALEGQGEESGQTAGQLARYALRVYAPAGDYGERPEQAGIDPERLLFTTAPEGYVFDPDGPRLPEGGGGILLTEN